VRIFVNEVAQEAIEADDFGGTLPPGSIILKENYMGTDPADPGQLAALTIMSNRQSRANARPASGGTPTEAKQTWYAPSIRPRPPTLWASVPIASLTPVSTAILQWTSLRSSR
jgi:hypothetical protein